MTAWYIIRSILLGLAIGAVVWVARRLLLGTKNAEMRRHIAF